VGDNTGPLMNLRIWIRDDGRSRSMRDTPDKRNDQRSGSLKVRDRRKKYQRPCMDAQQETVFRKNLKTISLFLKQFFKVIFYLDRRHYRMSP